MKIQNFAYISLAVVLFAVALACTPFLFQVETVRAMFSEQGIFEQASPIVWILAGLFALWKSGAGGLRCIILALTFFVFAGREWHLHKAFTSDSILKVNFYKDGFGLEQIFGGMVALIVIGLILSAVIIIIRYIIVERGYEVLGGQFFIGGLVLLVVSKVMDRAPSLLRKEFNILLEEPYNLTLLALEEGFEFLCPVLILLGVIYKYIDNKNLNSPI